MLPNCPSCREPVEPEMRSSDDPRYCQDCGDLVYAFRPNSQMPDEWFIVNTVEPYEKPIEGVKVSGEQCEDCGLSEYEVKVVARGEWAAVCTGQNYDGDFLEGCGAEHPIRMKKGHLVVW